MTTVDPLLDGHAPELTHDGSWWASCDCGWFSHQPMPTEQAATDEWAQHHEARP